MSRETVSHNRFVCERCGRKDDPVIETWGCISGQQDGGAAIFKTSDHLSLYGSLDLCPDCVRSLKVWWLDHNSK